MPEYYEIGHSLDPEVITRPEYFWAEHDAEIYVWYKWVRRVSETIIDDIFGKRSLQERRQYPQYIKEFPDDDKREITYMLWNPMRYIDDMNSTAREYPKIFKLFYKHL